MAKGLNREKGEKLGSLLSSVSHIHTCICIITKLAPVETDTIVTVNTDIDWEKIWHLHHYIWITGYIIFSLLLFQITRNLAAKNNTNVLFQSSVCQKYCQGFAQSGILSGGSGRKICFQVHSGCWQNLVTCSSGTEVLVSLQTVSLELLSDP